MPLRRDDRRGTSGLGQRSRFGKYEIVRRIADGGMATIYLASSTGPDGFSKLCALKLIRPEFSARAEVVRMLVQEAKVAALLNHPNIVQVFDFGKIDSEYFLTMEWIDGASLAEIFGQAVQQNRPVSLAVIIQIGAAIAQALAYLRTGVVLDGDRVNLVHRDVTPSNVLISSSGAIKLTDFGIVKVLEAPTSTNIGVVKGKYAYMSPEQLRGDMIDHRSDIFALGVILYELCTRRRLFRRKTLAATIAAVHAARVPPPSAIAPSVPAELDRIILRALAKQPGDRYQTAQEIVDDLWPLYTSQSRGANAELVQLVQHVAPTGAHGRRALRDEEGDATAPALFPRDERTPNISSDLEALEGEAGSVEDFDALENIEDALGAPNLPRPSQSSPTWSETGSLPEAAFESSAAGVDHTTSEGGKKREAMITAIVIAGSIIATIVFWLYVLK